MVNFADLVKWLREALLAARRGPVVHRDTSELLDVKRRARISARQLHLTAYLVLQISMTSRDYLFIIYH